MDLEQWKVVKEYPNYKVSTLGRVMNIKTQKILSGTSLNGYSSVCLTTSDGRCKSKFIHTLVAGTFLDNMIEGNVINHKNGKKEDNRLENLEEMTQSSNIQHAYDTGLLKAYTRAIKVYDLNMNFLKDFSSSKEAAEEFNIFPANITTCCSGKLKQVKGYIFKYSEERNEVVDDEELWKIFRDTTYKISNFGNVKNQHGKIMRQRKDIKGYSKIQLKINLKPISFLAHRLVAEVFHPNTEKMDTVDHIDGNISNNKSSNLRWMSRENNSRLASNKSTDQLDVNTGQVIKTWVSATEAAKQLNLDNTNISAVCVGRKWAKTCGGFGWRYTPQ